MFCRGLIALSLLSSAACIDIDIDFDIQEKGVTTNRVLESSQTRLYGGDNAPADRYPYFVRLVGAAQCGGALIAPDVVVTAAHCK